MSAKKWIIKSSPSLSGNSINYTAYFTSNNQRFENFQMWPSMEIDYDGQARYTSSGWTNDAYRTLEFEEEISDATLLNWLKENAVPVSRFWAMKPYVDTNSYDITVTGIITTNHGINDDRLLSGNRIVASAGSPFGRVELYKGTTLVAVLCTPSKGWKDPTYAEFALLLSSNPGEPILQWLAKNGYSQTKVNAVLQNGSGTLAKGTAGTTTGLVVTELFVAEN